MSESWGADLIPAAASGRLNLVEALSVAQHLPAEAIDEAVRRPNAVAEPVLALVERAAGGEALSARDQNLLFWGIHVLAAVRDRRLFEPLLRLLRLPGDALESLLGALTTTTLPRIAASVFDGNTAALKGVIADPTIDEFVRWSLWGGLTFLTFDGRVDRSETRAFVVRFDDERPARAGDAAWNGWWDAIALLGLDDLADRVRAAYEDARLLPDDSDESDFTRALAKTRARPADPARFAEHELGYLDDPVDVLDRLLGSDDEDAPVEEPVRNPVRDVGRNDPCPCGSGRKFKKCCLARDLAAPAGLIGD